MEAIAVHLGVLYDALDRCSLKLPAKWATRLGARTWLAKVINSFLYSTIFLISR